MKKNKSNIQNFFSNLKSSIKRYASTNILFFSFILITITFSFILRLFTLGTPIFFKAIVGDLLVVLVIGSFGYFFKPRSQFKYYFIWLLFYTALVIGNTIYFKFYHSFLSINLLATASMVHGVKAAAFDKLNIFQFLYILGDVLFILIHRKLNKTKYYYEVEKIESGRKRFVYSLWAALIILIGLAFTVSKADTSRFQKLWNREYVVQRYGLYIYHISDLIQSLQPHINTLFGYDEAALQFREYYACAFNRKKEVNEYTDYFKGKNVIFIHAESIQNFLIDLKINDKYVTPNINKLVHEGIYFNRFYPQISVGTSSDTEFTLTTGLMPSSSGTVFVNYFDRKYYALPQYFNDLGYYTFSAHANNGDYWNRRIMHKTLGYQDFYSKEYYEVPTDMTDPDWILLGLSDKSFFKQLTPILKNIKENRSPFMGTIITLSNHAPYNDIEKYNDFPVTMEYTYKDENGKKVKGTAPYLDGTEMGNYIKSAHYADEAIGELIKLLRDNDILKDTVIILYGDHESRIAKREFVKLYNYNPIEDDVLDEEDPNYITMENYNYDLLKNTPLIIWSDEEKYEKVVSDVMGMYDVLPTVANMFGFEEHYSLGNDIFSSNEKIVVFPNGNILTNKIYYSNLKEEYVAFENTVIDSDYIERINEHANKILDISNGIIMHDLIRNEENKIGACKIEKKN